MIYNWTAGGSNLPWDGAGNWDQPTPPGSLLNAGGATDDEVILINQSTGNNRNIRINNWDVGTIASMAIGGGKKQTTLQLRENGSNLDVTGNVTLGGMDGANNRVGNLTIGRSGKSSTMSIGGNIISGSTADHDILLNADGGSLTLDGNIDSVGVHEIDLRIQRGTFIWTGTEAYVEEFDLINTSNANVSSTLTLGPGQTLVASQRSDIGRNASGAGNLNKTTTGTLNIFGGTASFTNTGEALVVGNVNKDPNSGTTTAVGVINVGDLTNAGTLTVAGEVKLGPSQNQSNGGAQSASGTLTISNAGSVVTIGGGIEMAANGNEVGSATAVVTINDGLLTLHGHLEHIAGNSSTINLLGGVMHLASAGPIAKGRTVDNFNMENGAMLKMTFTGAGMPLTAAAMDLDVSVGGGSATLDIEIPGDPNAAPNTLEGVEWVGGTGTWDTTATNWDPNSLPAGGAGALLNGTTYTFLQTGGAAIANQANIQLDAGDTDWTIDLSDASKVQATYIGTTMGFGAVVARISDVADVVTRSTDLNIKNAVGEAADASQIEISDGSLTLSGSTNLILGAGSGPGDVIQSGGTVVIGGDLLFGGGNATDGGGRYYVSDNAVLTITGSVTKTDPGMTRADLYIDSTNVTIGGTVISVDDFRIGFAAGQTGSYTLTKDLTGTDELYIGDEGTGTLTVTGGTITHTGGEFRLGSAATGIGFLNVTGTNPVIIKQTGGNFETAENGTGTVVFDNPNLIYYQNTNNLIVGQSTTSVASFTLNAGIVDLTGELGLNDGDLNSNRSRPGETNTIDLNGGQMLIGHLWQLSQDANSSVIATIDGALVRVGLLTGGGIAYRTNGTDTINFKSGTLDLTGGVIDADTEPTDVFNWTGGTLMDVAEFQGDLIQGNSAAAASLLKIGASAGTMNVTGNYTLDPAGVNASALEIEIFGDGTGGAGVDFDKLIVTGTATLDATSSINLVLDLYVPVNGDSWDILDAAPITVVNGSLDDLFDTTQAVLSAGLLWNFSNFEASGTVGVVVPEPGTLSVLVLGALAALIRRRRR